MKTPVIFSDGSEIFTRLKKEFISHKEGRFILASSGTGKTHYVENQKDKHWIDGDYFWSLTQADLLPDEWIYDSSIVDEVNNRCDVMTQQAKKQGLWIVGSSNNWLQPDAIVIISDQTQKQYIKKRQVGDYDGGATDMDFAAIQRHNAFIKSWADKGVPQFSSIEDAAIYFIDLEP